MLHNGLGWTLPDQWAADIIRYNDIFTGVSSTEVVYGPVSGCYTVTIPYAFITATGNTVTEDLAVIEFTCGHSPGDYTGWIPAGVGTASDIQGSGTYIEGYDYGAPLPSSIVGSRNYSPGSMLTRYGGSYSAIVSTVVSNLVNHWLDSTPGSSGSGMLKNLFWKLGDNTYYWSAIHSRSSPDVAAAEPNGGRRNDWGLWWFIQDNTTEF